jgi:hypothetical protein
MELGGGVRPAYAVRSGVEASLSALDDRRQEGRGWKSEVRHGESVLRQIGGRIKPSKLDHPITVEEERGKTVSCLQMTGIFIQNET